MPIHGNEPLSQDGILFVRTDDILDTMVKVPLLVASVIIAVVAAATVIPIQTSLGSSFPIPRMLDLIIYPDGTTHVSTTIDMDPLSANYKLELFGSTVDNFVAVGEDHYLLESDVAGSSALIETFGSSVISVEYDIHDLVSKQGRIWTFSLETPSDFTLLLPHNSVIVTMTNIPIDSKITNEQNLLTLSGGSTEIDYIFASSSITTTTATPLPVSNLESTTVNLVLLVILGSGAAGAGVAATYFVKKKRQSTTTLSTISAVTPETSSIPNNSRLDVNISEADTIFKLRPDIREDDKEIVKFISDSGGKVLESDLRKKFLQPRTTMWRAVKRLERHEIIEIEKKDMQNLVKLRKDIEKREEV